MKRGFTLIELTVTLALVAVTMGLVVVRLSWGSPRQQTIAAARQLGAVMCLYREKAMAEECLYAVRLEGDTGRYTVSKPAERSAAAAQQAQALKSGRLGESLLFGAVSVQGTALQSPATLFLDGRSIGADASIEVVSAKGPVVTVRLDPVLGEAEYDER